MEIAIRIMILKTVFKKRRRDEDSSSSSDEEILSKMAKKTEYKKHGKIKQFVKNIVLAYSPSDFQAHFRLSKPNFEVSKNIQTYASVYFYFH